MKIFQLINWSSFLHKKTSSFKLEKEDYEFLFKDNKDITDNYENIIKIGEADLKDSDDLIVIAANTLLPLTERTGKKRQFEIAKKILTNKNKDAVFFIFYDNDGNFRFSFIRTNYIESKRDFTDFKRYTYFVSTHQTNQTFKNQINQCNFNSLDSIQEAFSVEPITKQFYEKLQYWYFWAIDNVKFPDDAEQESNGREVAIIRLITRLMFIWFMKVRKLIPDNLFNEKKIKKILQNYSSENSNYYKAILQNLFFATLNTKQKHRKFRSEKRGLKGFNPDFGDHNKFRYHDLFQDKQLLNTLFSKIPFLNGGLFECLDYKTKNKQKRKYIDGFTATKKHQPTIPNFLFFSKAQKVDISNFLGKTNKTYEVQGLINLLNNYNFTVDENEPDDIEVALDPELLGSIFENLLASYNPETATSARKATGSFYTPREIVNYMTTESLKQYFTTNLQSNNICDLNNNLTSLISLNNSKNPFDHKTTKNIINLINDLKMVDPAVGSGAFPMAMLNKLVFILGKLDPENKLWEQNQLNAAKNIPDPKSRKVAVQSIKKKFKEKNADYGRKLYLIEKCIYGVDIQQIAVEIAKLRFFISLLVDEKIDFNNSENNYGIEPLPNLDFKLMQGNSLISSFVGIDFKLPVKQEKGLFADPYEEAYHIKIKEFEDLKNEYQNESDKHKKDKLRDKINKSIIIIVEDKIKPHLLQFKRIEEKYSGVPNKQQREKAIHIEKQKLIKKIGFNPEQIGKDLIAYTEERKPKDFFLWNVYFAEVFSQKSGFDIVIGNPPYSVFKDKSKNELSNLMKNEIYHKAKGGKINAFELFLCKAPTLLKKNGINCQIFQNSFLADNSSARLRKFYLKEQKVLIIDSYPERDNPKKRVFENVKMSVCILLNQNTCIENYNFRVNFWNDKNKFSGKSLNYNNKNIVEFNPNQSIIYNLDINEKQLFEKYFIKNKTKYSDYYNCLEGELNITFHKEYFNKNDKNPLVVKGAQVQRYYLTNTPSQGEIVFVDKTQYLRNYSKSKKSNHHKKVRVAMQGITGANDKIRIVSTLIERDIFLANSCNYIITRKNSNRYSISFLLGLFNSKFTNWIFRRSSTNSNVNCYEVNNLKLPKYNRVLYDKIANYAIISLNNNSIEFQKQIDLMVYKLYELTYKEVKIIEPEFELSKKEYENYG